MAKNTGSKFEGSAYRRLRLDFEKVFALRGNFTQFRRKPKYVSEDREGVIVFDMSIELRAAKTAEPFLIFVIECKDYKKTIPVDDVEEFKAKLDQCFGKNVKGVLITRGNLQKSALTYARSNGIAVLRLIPRGHTRVIAYKLAPGVTIASVNRSLENKLRRQASKAIVTRDYLSTRSGSEVFNAFGLDGACKYVGVAEMFKGMLCAPGDGEKSEMAARAQVKLEI